MLGFAAGGLLTERGVFDFLISGLTPPIFSLSDATSLPALLGITPAWVILGVVGFVGFLLWALSKPPRTAGSWAWYETGLVLAVVAILAWVAGAPTGWHWGLSMTGPSRSLLAAVLDQTINPLNWGVFMLLGVPLGSFLSARLNGTASWQLPQSREFPRRFLGGFLMGFGGTLAGGCNIGNALTGLSLLALNSAVATASIVFGLALAVRVQGIVRCEGRSDCA